MPITLNSFSASPQSGLEGTQTTVSWSGSGVSSWVLLVGGSQAAQGSGQSGSVQVTLTPPPGGWQTGDVGRQIPVELRLTAPDGELRRFLDLYCIRDTMPTGSGGSLPARPVRGVPGMVLVYRALISMPDIVEVVLRKYEASSASASTPYSQEISLLSGPGQNQPIPFGTVQTLWTKQANGAPQLITPDGKAWGAVFKHRTQGGATYETYLGQLNFPNLELTTPPQAVLEATPAVGAAPYNALLSWSTDGASSVRIRFNGGAWQTQPARGAFTVAVTATTVVELEAQNPHGTVLRTVTLEAIQPPSIQFSLSPASLHGPGQATLSWTVTGADAVTLNGAPVAASGTQTIQIASASQAGQHHYDLVAVRQAGQVQLTASERRTLTVTWPPALVIGTAALPPAENVRPYSVQLSGSGGFGNPQNYSWSIVAGQLPPGLSLSPSGLLSGTADISASGVYPFRVRLSDDGLEPAERDFELQAVYVAPVSVSAPPSYLARQLQPIDLPLVASGGYGSYQWSASGLPSGLSLQAGTGPEAWLRGSLSGLASADYTVSIQAVSSSSDGQVVLSDTAVVRIEYRFVPVSIPDAPLPHARAEESWQAEIAADGGLPPYEWSWQGLPAWAQATVDDSGRLRLSGTPARSDEGQFVLEVSVRDAASMTDSASYTVQVRRSWASMDPFHTIFYRVYDRHGQLVPGMTNDPYPDDPKTVIGRLVAGFTVGADDVRIEDIRQRGGGLRPEFHTLPEADHFWDIGFLDGRPWPAGSLALVLLPAGLRQRFSRQQLEAIVEAALPLGCLPVLRFYGQGDGWQPMADF